jgi:hypothetical protein
MKQTVSTGDRILEAVQINDTLVREHGTGDWVMGDLGVDPTELMVHAKIYAEIAEKRYGFTHDTLTVAFAMGILGGLRMAKLAA